MSKRRHGLRRETRTAEPNSHRGRTDLADRDIRPAPRSLDRPRGRNSRTASPCGVPAMPSAAGEIRQPPLGRGLDAFLEVAGLAQPCLFLELVLGLSLIHISEPT